MAVTDDAMLRLTALGAHADLIIDRPLRAAPDDAPPPGRDGAPQGAPRPHSAQLARVRQLPTTIDDRSAGRSRFEVQVDGWVIVVTAESAARAALRERATRLASVAGHAGPQVIKAKLPGRVAQIWVEVGTSVQQGERLLSIEAMKMENEIRAPHAGTVMSIAVAVGDRVELGNELAVVG
jgi:biotin carboxyl carrier protein